MLYSAIKDFGLTSLFLNEPQTRQDICSAHRYVYRTICRVGYTYIVRFERTGASYWSSTVRSPLIFFSLSSNLYPKLLQLLYSTDMSKQNILYVVAEFLCIQSCSSLNICLLEFTALEIMYVALKSSAFVKITLFYLNKNIRVV